MCPIRQSATALFTGEGTVVRYVAIFLVLTIASIAGAQTPPAIPQILSAPAPTPDPNVGRVLYGEQPLFEVIDAKPYEPRWRMDLLLGAPTGIRFQRQLGESRLWAEVGAGGYLWWPTVFAGVRSEGRMFSGASDVLSVRPGLIAYYLQGYTIDDRSRNWDGWDGDYRIRTAGMVAIDFDLSWKHRWLDSLHGEIALKLGAGVAFTNRCAYVLPLAGLSLGVNY